MLPKLWGKKPTSSALMQKAHITDEVQIDEPSLVFGAILDWIQESIFYYYTTIYGDLIATTTISGTYWENLHKIIFT